MHFTIMLFSKTYYLVLLPYSKSGMHHVAGLVSGLSWTAFFAKSVSVFCHNSSQYSTAKMTFPETTLVGHRKCHRRPLGGRADSENNLSSRRQRAARFPRLVMGKLQLSSVMQSVKDIKQGQHTLGNQTCL